jgi:hypothetical protein
MRAFSHCMVFDFLKLDYILFVESANKKIKESYENASHYIDRIYRSYEC